MNIIYTVLYCSMVPSIPGCSLYLLIHIYKFYLFDVFFCSSGQVEKFAGQLAWTSENDFGEE